MALKTKVPGTPGSAPQKETKASPNPSKASSPANVRTTFGTPTKQTKK